MAFVGGITRCVVLGFQTGRMKKKKRFEGNGNAGARHECWGKWNARETKGGQKSKTRKTRKKKIM